METLFVWMPVLAALPSLFPCDAGITAEIFIALHLSVSSGLFPGNIRRHLPGQGDRFAMVSNIAVVTGDRLIVAVGIFFLAPLLFTCFTAFPGKGSIVPVVLFSLPSLWLALVMWQSLEMPRVPVTGRGRA